MPPVSVVRSRSEESLYNAADNRPNVVLCRGPYKTSSTITNQQQQEQQEQQTQTQQHLRQQRHRMTTAASGMDTVNQNSDRVRGNAKIALDHAPLGRCGPHGSYEPLPCPLSRPTQPGNSDNYFLLDRARPMGRHDSHPWARGRADLDPDDLDRRDRSPITGRNNIDAATVTDMGETKNKLHKYNKAENLSSNIGRMSIKCTEEDLGIIMGGEERTKAGNSICGFQQLPVRRCGDENMASHPIVRPRGASQPPATTSGRNDVTLQNTASLSATAANSTVEKIPNGARVLTTTTNPHGERQHGPPPYSSQNHVTDEKPTNLLNSAEVQSSSKFSPTRRIRVDGSPVFSYGKNNEINNQRFLENRTVLPDDRALQTAIPVKYSINGSIRRQAGDQRILGLHSSVIMAQRPTCSLSRSSSLDTATRERPNLRNGKATASEVPVSASNHPRQQTAPDSKHTNQPTNHVSRVDFQAIQRRYGNRSTSKNTQEQCHVMYQGVDDQWDNLKRLNNANSEQNRSNAVMFGANGLTRTDNENRLENVHRLEERSSFRQRRVTTNITSQPEAAWLTGQRSELQFSQQLPPDVKSRIAEEVHMSGVQNGQQGLQLPYRQRSGQLMQQQPCQNRQQGRQQPGPQSENVLLYGQQKVSSDQLGRQNYRKQLCNQQPSSRPHLVPSRSTAEEGKKLTAAAADDSSKRLARLNVNRTQNHAGMQSPLVHYFSNPELHEVGRVTDDKDGGKEVKRLHRLLRDREAELFSIRKTFVKNECAILQVLEDQKRDHQAETAARQLEWDQRLADHVQRSLKHDAILRRQLGDVQNEVERLQAELRSLTSQRDELLARDAQQRQSPRNESSALVTSSGLEMHRGHLPLSSCADNGNSKRVHNGKIGVWSIVGKHSASAPSSSLSSSSLSAGSNASPCAGFRPVSSESDNHQDKSTTSGGVITSPKDDCCEGNRPLLVEPLRMHAKIPSSSELFYPGSVMYGSRERTDRKIDNQISVGDSYQMQSQGSDSVERIGDGWEMQDGCEPQTRISCSRIQRDSLVVAVGPDTKLMSHARMPSSSELFYPGGTGSNANTYISADVGSTDASEAERIRQLSFELSKAREEITNCCRRFDREREQWLEEKAKVIRYQSTLQNNFVQLLNKNKFLESELGRVGRLAFEMIPFREQQLDSEC